MVFEDLVDCVRAPTSVFFQGPEIEFQHSLSIIWLLGANPVTPSLGGARGTAIRYALVHLSHPFIEKHLTESNVIYGSRSDFGICRIRSQVLNWDCDVPSYDFRDPDTKAT